MLLFLFEYRAATVLIHNQFPGATAGAITKFEIDNDVISLDGRDPLCTESEVDVNGRLRVRIRRSTSSVPGSAILSPSIVLTPRDSNLTNAEIFSLNTPMHDQLIHHANADNNNIAADLGFGFAATSPRLSSGYASSDAYSLQPTPCRASNSNETTDNNLGLPTWIRSSPLGEMVFLQQPSPAKKSARESPGKPQGDDGTGGGGDGQDPRDGVRGSSLIFVNF